MSRATFLDTGYVLALLNTADQWHAQARAAALQVAPPFVTTEAVLVEIGNALSRTRWRHLGIATRTTWLRSAGCSSSAGGGASVTAKPVIS